MTWTYKVSTGELTHNGEFVGTGYSGKPECRNDSTKEAIHDKGPIPRQRWIIGKPYDDPLRGPCVMRLVPVPPDDAFGRSGFLIHGDNKTHDASSGCIILGPSIRKEIANSNDYDLLVI